MREFFLAQMDYIFFVYGLAFVLLFSVCFSLQKRPQALIPWNYLGLFGLIHGINEWLDMAALNLPDGRLFQSVRLGIMTLSFIYLLEFGRLTCERLNHVKIGRWIYVPLFLAVLSEIPAGIPGLNAAIRYALGLTGGLWAAFAMVLISKANKEGAWAAVLAAGAMAIYAVAAGFVVPKAGLLSASCINHDSFLSVAGFPIQLLRSAAACAIAVMIWLYHEEVYAKKIDLQMVRQEKRLAGGVFLALILVLSLGWLWVDMAGQKEGFTQRTQLLTLEINHQSMKISPRPGKTGHPRKQTRQQKQQ